MKFLCDQMLGTLAKWLRLLGFDTFYASSDISDDELLKLAKEAGCVAWYIGFETFSQEALDNVGKTTNVVERYKEVVEKIHKNRMAVIGSFIIGFDEETEETLSNYSKNIDDLKLDGIELGILTPFPGTPLFDQMEKNRRILTRDWTKYSEGNEGDIVFQPKHMSEEKLREYAMGVYMDHIASYRAVIRNIKTTIRGFKLGFYPIFWSFLQRGLWV